MKDLPATIRRCLTDTLGEGARAPGIVAVSGGADSVALLWALASLRPELHLVVGHFNHRLRGEESDGDERFVRELGESLGVPVEVGSADVRERAEREKANLEDLARRLRYEFLADMANRAAARWIATGHTGDDQAETLLHRLVRGTGLQGLRGIARRRELKPGLFLVRPMLEVSRTDVISFLSELNQPHREDSSNSDPQYTRNRIRHELLPLLKSFNPQITRVLSRLGEQAEDEFAERETESAELLRRCRLPSAGSLAVLETVALVAVSIARIREMLRHLWHLENWPRRYLTRDHWETMAEIVRGAATAVDLPDGMRMDRKGSVVRVGPKEVESAEGG
jgi:tRNA(Ile)-lysidine synthase